MIKKYNLLLLIVACLMIECRPSSELPAYDYGKPGRKKLPKMTLLNHNKVMKDILGDPKIEIKTIGILVYDGVNTIESVGPMAVFSELMSVKIDYISPVKGQVNTTHLAIESTKSLSDVEELDLLLVPGGDSAAMHRLLNDPAMIEWIRNTDSKTKLTASVGNGTFLLGKAGVLANRNIALPWYEAERNAQLMNANYRADRYLNDRKYYTAVEGTAAIDLALYLIGETAGIPNLQGAMLDLEYDPQPPTKAGKPLLTSLSIVEKFRHREYTIDGYRLVHNQHISLKPKLTNIGILVYPDFFTLDAIGPLVVLSQLPGAKIKLLSTDGLRLKSGRTHLFATEIYSRDKEGIDILLVPGGSTGTWALTQDKKILDWLVKTDSSTTYTGSVCTGSWVLGAAGLLKGRQASTNWYRAGQMMDRYGATFSNGRYTIDGKYWTSAGVSAGIDMSFALIEDLTNSAGLEEAMLNLAYHPEPPIHGGSPEKTDDLVLDMMQQMYDYVMGPLIKP